MPPKRLILMPGAQVRRVRCVGLLRLETFNASYIYCFCLYFLVLRLINQRGGQYGPSSRRSSDHLGRLESLTYPQRCVHTATPKIHQYGTSTPTGKPDPAVVAACQQVTSAAALDCLRREATAGAVRYTSFKAGAMRVFPALTADQVKACASP